MKNILINLVAALVLLTLFSCGGGGGGSNPPPQAATYVVSFASAGNGTLSGTTSQTVSQGTSASAVTAVAANGYHFVSWTEGSTVVGVNTNLTVTDVAANHSYTANFAANSGVKTTAILKINLTGTLPVDKAVSGAAFTLILPSNVSPALTNGNVINGVVVPSGAFGGGTQAPPVYTPAISGVPGTLYLILASSEAVGTTQVGEIATVTLQLSNGATPAAGDFLFGGNVSVTDVLYSPIGSMSVSVASVILQ